MLTRYGIDNIIAMISIGLILMIAALYLNKAWISPGLVSIGLLLVIFTFVFFRDPERSVPQKAIDDYSWILAPADGTVMEIVNDFEGQYLKSECKRISIFLSPLDVHVNRVPSGGVIKYFNHKIGKFLVAYDSGSSVKNEQTTFGLENEYGKIVFKQIVGILARRLVWDIDTGDKVGPGMRFGMMKFGSRMDIFVPISADIFINKGDKVVAGESIIAKLKINNNNNKT